MLQAWYPRALLVWNLVGHGSAVYNFGNRTSGAILHYEFPRSECTTGTFFDSVGTGLFGTLTRSSESSCNDGLGVTLSGYNTTSGGAQVVSSADATAFKAAMAGNGEFTLEFWAQTEDDSSSSTNRPVVTIGAVGDTTPSDCEAGGPHATYGLTVYDRESNNKVRQCDRRALGFIKLQRIPRLPHALSIFTCSHWRNRLLHYHIVVPC